MSSGSRLPEGLRIPSDKIVKYLLNPNHPKGGSKAGFFLRFGFNAERTAEFADALFAQARGATSLQRYPTEFGKEMLECAGRMPARRSSPLDPHRLVGEER